MIHFEVYLKALVGTKSFKAHVVERRLFGLYLTRCDGCRTPYETEQAAVEQVFRNGGEIRLSCTCGTTSLLKSDSVRTTVAEKPRSLWRKWLSRLCAGKTGRKT